MMAWLRKRLALRSYRRRLGRALVERYGREHRFAVKQVHLTAEKLWLDLEHIDYAYAAYSGRELYEEHHAARGEPCDWRAVRAQVGRIYVDVRDRFTPEVSNEGLTDHSSSVG